MAKRKSGNSSGAATVKKAGKTSSSPNGSARAAKSPNSKPRESAKGAAPLFPEGTLIYCLRNQRQIAARLPGGEVVSVVHSGQQIEGGNDDSDRLVLAMPYGVAVNNSWGQLWIADKHRNVIWALGLGLSKGNSTNGQRYAVTDAEAIPTPMRGPCMLDWDGERGLLAAFYGECGSPGGVARYSDGEWETLTPEEFRGFVTHCCWLPDGGYCFVSRSHSLLYIARKPGQEPCPVTAPGNVRKLCPPEGDLEQLRLRYVQGLRYAPGKGVLLAADASLGAIFEIDLAKNRYRCVAGRPVLQESGAKALVSPGNKAVWLGPVRAVEADSKGDVVWLDGESGRLLKLGQRQDISLLGPGIPDGLAARTAGAGMVFAG